jgi:uncharacterized CHY-type Zn-finger protein
MISGSPEVRGVNLDPQTRCAHYHTALDVVAIKMKCCGVYYACKDCHEALAGHDIQLWTRDEWTRKAVVCGCCRTELSINDYIESGHRCPACNAEFNPACSTHYRFYFETPAEISKSPALR